MRDGRQRVECESDSSRVSPGYPHAMECEDRGLTRILSTNLALTEHKMVIRSEILSFTRQPVNLLELSLDQIFDALHILDVAIVCKVGHQFRQQTAAGMAALGLASRLRSYHPPRVAPRRRGSKRQLVLREQIGSSATAVSAVRD